ncbi:MAG: hypothetical protein ACRDYX_23425 [Egibacteraceae bacterium]
MTLGQLQTDAAGVAPTSDRHALEACGTGAPRHCTSENSNVIYAQALTVHSAIKHGQVLRDTNTADWLILLDAGDPDSLHALDCAEFDALEAARHIELPNPDTGPILRVLGGSVAGPGGQPAH